VPVTVTLPAPMRGQRLERGLHGRRGRVVSQRGSRRPPLKVSENVPPVGEPVMVTVCTSLVEVPVGVGACQCGRRPRTFGFDSRNVTSKVCFWSVRTVLNGEMLPHRLNSVRVCPEVLRHPVGGHGTEVVPGEVSATMLAGFGVPYGAPEAMPLAIESEKKLSTAIAAIPFGGMTTAPGRRTARGLSVRGRGLAVSHHKQLKRGDEVPNLGVHVRHPRGQR
jgi:hypothetical protein